MGGSVTGYRYKPTIGPSPPDCFSPKPVPRCGELLLSQRLSSGLYMGVLAAEHAFFSVSKTTVTCCPSASYSFGCITDSTKEKWAVFLKAGRTTRLDSWVISAYDTSGLPSSALSKAFIAPAGNAIFTDAVVNTSGAQVRSQPSDEALLFGTSSVTRTATRKSAKGSSTQAGDEIPAQTSQSHALSGGRYAGKRLRTGTVVGITVSAVVGDIVLIGLIVWLALTKRCQRRRWERRPPSELPGHIEKPTRSARTASARSPYDRRKLLVADRRSVTSWTEATGAAYIDS
ncbi:hypothetical protein GGR56DRAFT_679190 [Xylariaceae sp. FL0804]|nr:hypothetical protein GGR56DRAFT_679190 [Xylariaceae sp. FL0804]